MRLRRQLNLAVYPFVAFMILTGCGRVEPFDAVNVAQGRRAPSAVTRTALPLVAADQAIAFSRWLAGVQWRGMIAFAEATRDAVASPPVARQAPVASAAPVVDWACVAVAETGADFTMHGPTYSTAYGVVNDIVEDYASPEVAARVFAGTASQAEQTDIVKRFAADNGTGGWGELTKQKCGL